MFPICTRQAVPPLVASVLELPQGKSPLIERGIDSDAYTMAELEAQYIAEKTVFADVCINLNRWLPALASCARWGRAICWASSRTLANARRPRAKHPGMQPGHCRRPFSNLN